MLADNMRKAVPKRTVSQCIAYSVLPGLALQILRMALYELLETNAPPYAMATYSQLAT